MRRLGLACATVLALSACGGARVQGTAPQVAFASGPIQQACHAGGRKEASRARCGCVQAVANQSLSASDQRRGARYFKDPHGLQEVRQSDVASNERFWLAWKAFGQEAAAACGGT